MDEKRLFLAIGLSIAVLLGYQALLPRHPAPPPVAHHAAGAPPPPKAFDPAFPVAKPLPAAVRRDDPRLPIDAPRVVGSIDLRGARIDDLRTRGYHETVDKASPMWPVLVPPGNAQPTYAQLGWTAETPGVAVPDNDTVWTATGGKLAAGNPVTLAWDNGAGLRFEIGLSIDDDYMIAVRQDVRNGTGQPVSLRPWGRVRRDYTPGEATTYLLHEGPVGVVGGTLHELGYAALRGQDPSFGQRLGGWIAGALGNPPAPKPPEPRVGFTAGTTGGWAGITDKYMLTALVPAQAVAMETAYRYLPEDGRDHYQVDMAAHEPMVVSPGATASAPSHLFSGAKEVRLLDRYSKDLGIPSFDKAVDFGWFYFLTKPIFYALDWLSVVMGNFGLAILVFTVAVKLLFFPLASYSFRSMARMKVLGPRVAEMRERHKDDPAAFQKEMMELYKNEGVNPAGSCLPMLVQIPVFFCLYKVIYVTIEMWHAPFYGWIRDLSSPDPTNVFTLFGLIRWDPTHWSPLLHLGVWPVIMGCTMVAQQMFNPPPPDPTQARLFRIMPIFFTFMLGRFPAGLVIYWSWNNLLTIAQQALIQARSRAPSKPRAARA